MKEADCTLTTLTQLSYVKQKIQAEKYVGKSDEIPLYMTYLYI